MDSAEQYSGHTQGEPHVADAYLLSSMLGNVNGSGAILGCPALAASTPRAGLDGSRPRLLLLVSAAAV